MPIYLCNLRYLYYTSGQGMHMLHETCPCNEHPLTPHFYIVKLGFTGVYFFLIFAPKHRLWVLVRTALLTEAVLTCTHNQCFEQK